MKRKPKNIAGVWSLLAVALAIVTLLSLCDELNLPGGLTLKTSGIAERLTREPELPPEEAATLSPDSLIEKMNPDTVAVAKPDTTSHNILIFGDSMLEGLTRRLAAYADENGHTLNSVIWYSSSTKVWAEGDTLRKFIKKYHPSYIFISLGGNELFIRDIAQSREKYVRKILKEIGDIPYIWIGPPNWKKDTCINDLIASCTAPGCFFLSNGMHFDRQKDGAHPTYESAALWVDSIARWMPLHAAHPIKMKKPTKATGRAASQVMLTPPK